METLRTLPRDTDPLTMMLHLEERHFLADHNLNYLDKTTMAFGVEGRVPLLDLELVEFAAAVPSRFKVSRLQGKYLFKKAMEPFTSARGHLPAQDRLRRSFAPLDGKGLEGARSGYAVFAGRSCAGRI